jgi:hypothetical protein
VVVATRFAVVETRQGALATCFELILAVTSAMLVVQNGSTPLVMLLPSFPSPLQTHCNFLLVQSQDRSGAPYAYLSKNSHL